MKLLIILMIGSINYAKAEDWVCKSQSSLVRSSNSILTCGIGLSENESLARELAYTNALKEFKKKSFITPDRLVEK